MGATMDGNEGQQGGLRCRPGDLAIVTKCGVPERIGLIVRVIERRTERGYDWLTEVQGGGVLGRDVTTGKVGHCGHLLMRDQSLTPLNSAARLHQQSSPAVAPVSRVA
jgi:hypothetical protein